jgi:hypothetical protein
VTVTLGNVPCTDLVLNVPGYGLWFGTATTTLAETSLTGQVTLSAYGTTWAATILAGALVEGKARYRFVAGRGQWGKTVPPKAYANDAGVTALQVLRDVARETGETVVPPTKALGPHWVRTAGAASLVLHAIAPRAWYSDQAGAVQFGSWPALPKSNLPVVREDPATGLTEIAVSDSLVGLLPGTATAHGAALDVEIQADSDGVRALLWASPKPNRPVSALGQIIAALDPTARYRGAFEYRVLGQSGERLTLQPVRTRSSLPDLQRVPVRLPPGVRADWAPGSLCVVTFLDGDPARPVVIAGDAPDSPAWMPVALEFGAPGALGVARISDAVVAGPFAGTITTGSLRVKAVL